MKKIVIMGSTGAGKTTLATQMSIVLGIQFIELDALFWQEGWSGKQKDEFQQCVRAAIDRESWIVDGNYESARQIIWREADTLVWLDYSFSLIFFRLIKRILIRAINKELLWGTNIDPGWVHLKLWSKDSLINWLFQTYWKRKREMPLMIERDGKHLDVVIIRSQKDLDKFLGSI